MVMSSGGERCELQLGVGLSLCFHGHFHWFSSFGSTLQMRVGWSFAACEVCFTMLLLLVLCADLLKLSRIWGRARNV